MYPEYSEHYITLHLPCILPFRNAWFPDPYIYINVSAPENVPFFREPFPLPYDTNIRVCSILVPCVILSKAKGRVEESPTDSK